ncbi:MAG: ATP-binding protein [Leptonema sp. (in: Bacteria)]|nr:ATP-binding protein [Leptonema sp. (in: bacteria)]
MKTAQISAIILEDNLFAQQIQIEALIRPGLPIFRITGTNVRSKDREERIRAAIIASGIQFPYSTVLVNLSPVDSIKESALLDLPIAVCLLSALDQLAYKVESDWLYLGELSLTGNIQSTTDTTAWSLCASEIGFNKIFLPTEAVSQLPNSKVEYYGLHNLKDLLNKEIKPSIPNQVVAVKPDDSNIELESSIGRILSIAATGRHPTLFVGPQGSGKSYAARSLYSMLPKPTDLEIETILKNKIVFDELRNSNLPSTVWRPFRNPHHSITVSGMVGGGVPLRAGEANRATDGLLLLDEIAEYDRPVIEALREPLERHEIHHNRNGRPSSLPARFWFIATANPCPCGKFRSENSVCRCSRKSIDRRRSMILGPFGDRIDIQVFVDSKKNEPIETVTVKELVEKVEAGVAFQRKRNSNLFNSELDSDEYFTLDDSAKKYWSKLINNFGSRRQEIRIKRLARTIADLDESHYIRAEDLIEAESYRLKEDFFEAAPPSHKVT